MWVKHFKDGNTNVADHPRSGRPRNATTERKKPTISSDETEGCGSGEGGDFGISENLFPLVSPFAYRGKQNGWELLSHPPYSLDLAPSDYNLFGPLKYHLRGHHYETDEAVQEAD
jgi:hypothetical protein